MQALTHALSALAATPASGTEPAGGAAIGQVVLATAMAGVAFAVLAWLCMGHRAGTVPYLARAAATTERIAGIPGWAALPSFLSAVSLLVALLGMYWDISLHIDVGRDPGPLANPAHYLILAGLFGILAAGTLAVFLPSERPGPSAVHIAGNWYAPVGGILIAVCGAFALIGFPLDDLWHRLFGQDVTLWGPTHLMLIGGAAMTLVGQAVLLVEGMRARKETATTSTETSLAVRVRRVGLMGGLLIGLSTFQGEFDFGVPQFRFIFEPILLALAASVALVCARLWIGRGGALLAAAMFVLVRGTVGLIVWGVFGETFPHLPIYLAEAAIVELTALALTRGDRELSPVALGAISGALIGTVGFAAEYGWSQFAMPLPWTTDLLPEGVILATVIAIAGGLVGALLGIALRGELTHRPWIRAIPLTSLLTIMVVVGIGLVTSVPSGVRADVTLTDTTPKPNREVQATVRINPADAASNPAWFTATSWQGGGLVVNRLAQRGPGTYRTTEPIPVYGDWKAMIRLQRGDEVLGIPIYLPEDPAIPAPKVPAPDHFTRTFTSDHQILQREQNQDIPGWLDLVAHLVVLAIALSLLAGLAWGVGRIGHDSPHPRRERRPATSLRPVGAR
jgi:hypothetical protein